MRNFFFVETEKDGKFFLIILMLIALRNKKKYQNQKCNTFPSREVNRS
jgi:hypothetical protein